MVTSIDVKFIFDSARLGLFISPVLAIFLAFILPSPYY